MKKRVICTISGALAIFGAARADAFLLLEKTEAQAIRADISKQIAGFTACMVKANLACESSGVWDAQECDLGTGTATAPGDAKGKYAGDIAKCVSKLNYLKKNKTYTDSGAYEAIGCPGDSDSNVAGKQRYQNMTKFQSAAVAVVRASVTTLGAVLPIYLTGVDHNPGGPPILDPDCSPADPTNPKDLAAANKCVAGYAGLLGKWTAAVQKCIADCENDYQGKKGNGGAEDVDPSVNCGLETTKGTTAAVGADPVFKACVEKSYAGLTKKGPPPGRKWGIGAILGCPDCEDLTGFIANTLNSSNNTNYNSPGNCN